MRNFLKKILPPSIILWIHLARGVLAAIWYGFPGRQLRVIGVTGTNGKTTTCHLIAEVLEQAGFRVGMATTINFKIGSKTWVNETRMTTLSPFALQKLLRQMVKAHCQFAVLETSSHAIYQHRVWGIAYEVAVLTNVTAEHLDYHKTLAEYREVKMRLFRDAKTSVINLDDKSAKQFIDESPGKIYTYGLETKPDISGRKLFLEPQGTLFTVITPVGQTAINLKLPGKFNVYNALAAVALGSYLKIDLVLIKKALEKVKLIPGRMEKVEMGQNFTIIIDYAVTPDSLAQIYETLDQSKHNKIISVLGACGDRDRTKRPILGALAGRYADYVIVTNEDPYTEDPRSIMEQVASGVPRGATAEKKKKEGENFWLIDDRYQAIKKALELASKGDIVTLTGKGAETCMVVGDQKIPWSERKVVEELLTKK